MCGQWTYWMLPTRRWLFMAYLIFQNQGTPSCLGAASSSVFLSGFAVLALSEQQYFSHTHIFQHIILFSVVINIHFTLCTNMTFLKDILHTNYRRFCSHSLVCMGMIYFGPYKTNQDETIQGKTLGGVSQTRQKWWLMVLKNTLSEEIRI